MEVVEADSTPFSSIEKRKSVIVKLCQDLPPDDKVHLLELMQMPVATPTEEEIGDLERPRKCTLLFGITPHGMVSWGYFSGVGSVLIHFGEGVIDFWLDAFKGDGVEARIAYLRSVVRHNWPEAISAMSAAN